MTDQSELRRQRVRYSCPACGEAHVATVDVRLEPEPIVFGGTGENPTQPRRRTVECARDHTLTDVDLPLTVPLGYLVASFEVVGRPEPAASDDAVTAPADERTSADASAAAYEEVRKQSIEAVRRFAAALLSTSTAGVAVYFAVLKYLGLESTEEASLLWESVTVLPAALLVGSAAASVWAAQPALTVVPLADLAAHRADYLRSRTRRVNIAAALLLVATLMSVLVWASVMLR